MTKFSCKLLDNFKVIDTHGRTSSDMTTFSVIYIYIKPKLLKLPQFSTSA